MIKKIILSGFLLVVAGVLHAQYALNLSVSTTTPNAYQNVVFGFNSAALSSLNWSGSIDFGETAPMSIGGTPSNPYIPNPIVFTYTTPGVKNVVLTVTDNVSGTTYTDAIVVTVGTPSCPVPVASSVIENVCLGDAVELEFTTHFGTGWQIIETGWGFGDGNTAITTGNTYSYIYANPGVYYWNGLVTYENTATGDQCTQQIQFLVGEFAAGQIQHIQGTQSGAIRVIQLNPVITLSEVPVQNDPFDIYLNVGANPMTGYEEAYDYSLTFYPTSGPSLTLASGFGVALDDINMPATVPTHVFNSPDVPNGNLEFTVTYKDQCATTTILNIDNYVATGGVTSDSVVCDTCESFKLKEGSEYWMSAWVKVDRPNQVISYSPNNAANEAHVSFSYAGTVVTQEFFPVGEIIDGWQRMVGKFVIPTGAYELIVGLVADQNFTTYFDDIRIHPFNGSMKSYVYDGETFWLTAELDDNNYATIYEYDSEGGLVRIKKETERGIVTIQTTRSHTSTNEP